MLRLIYLYLIITKEFAITLQPRNENLYTEFKIIHSSFTVLNSDPTKIFEKDKINAWIEK